LDDCLPSLLSRVGEQDIRVLDIMCSDFVLGVPVLEAVLNSHGPQVVRVPVEDPQGFASKTTLFALVRAIGHSRRDSSDY
jgi:hypothetical protein